MERTNEALPSRLATSTGPIVKLEEGQGSGMGSVRSRRGGRGIHGWRRLEGGAIDR